MANITESKKKILFLITKSDFGGAQRYVFDLATNLPKEKYSVVVATGGTGALINKLKAAEVTTITLPSLQRDISLLKELRSLREIAQLIKSEKPEVLHINSSKAGILGAVIGRCLSVPKIVFTAHGWAFNENRNLLSRLLFKTLHFLTVILAHQTIAVSYTLKEQLNWPGAQKKMTVVYNGRLQPTLQSKERSRMVLAEHNAKLQPYLNDLWSITIAELHPIKQHDVAISAIKKLVKEGFTIRHLIIGSGELQEKLAKTINDLGLQEHVFLLGHVDEAAQYLKAADIFVLPSRSEALAYVVIEACQAGVPVVASRVGGIPEIISHEEEGFLVDSGNEKTLTTAIKTLAQDSALRHTMSEKASKKGLKFSLSRMVGGTIAVYEKE